MVSVVVSGRTLELASKRNNFSVPENELVFFGIRGALPENSESNSFASEHGIQFTNVDHKGMRCTIGQWNRRDNTIALFEGSTVASQGSVAAAKARGGRGCNRLIPGRYMHEKGTHKSGQQGGHRAFRQAKFFPVQRTVNDVSYDNYDRIDFGSGSGSFVWDNIHCAYSETLERFSSAGCQVVRGLPKSPARGNAPETGPWSIFVENAYTQFSNQRNFIYLLFTADEIGVVANNEPGKIQQVVKFGSSGELAKQVQNALVVEGLLSDTPDGDFGRNSLIALTAFQARKFGQGIVDGVCGQQTSAALGLKMPTLVGAVLPLPGRNNPDQPDGSTSDLPDETDLTNDELQRWLTILFGPRAGTATEGSSPSLIEVPAISEELQKDMQGSIDKTSLVDASRSTHNFSRSQELLKEFEGGFVNHPDDPGRATNFGITAKTLADWRKVNSVSVVDVMNMSYAEACEIYKAWYWDRNRCGDFIGPIALAVYNVGVHCGTKTSATYLQRALNKLGASLEVDGNIGSNTVAAVRLAPAKDILDNIIDLYEERLMGHPKIAIFKAGFLDRVAKLRLETTKWLVEAELASHPTEATPPISKVRSTSQNVGATDMNRNLESILRKVLADVSAVLAASNATGGQIAPTPQGQLGSVNGALGQTIGELLNGKKTGIGIIGALLTTLLGNSSPDSVLGGLGSALSKALPIFAGSGGTLLPVFIAIAAWGVLGKAEKWSGNSK